MVLARPRGWRDPRDLLEHLADLVGKAHPPNRDPAFRPVTSARLLGGAPKNAEKRARLFGQEVEQAGELLGNLIARIRRIPFRRIPSAAERRELLIIAERWNAAIRKRGWWTLPTLCETCVRLVLRRAIEPGSAVLPTVCSDRCRHARNAVNSAKRR